MVVVVHGDVKGEEDHGDRSGGRVVEVPERRITSILLGSIASVILVGIQSSSNVVVADNALL